MAESSNYGLSRTGFKRKRLPEIQQSMRDRLADKLGAQLETGANSILGQIIGVFAYELADLWELAENEYNAMYPSTAQGVSLSRAAGLAGIAQITAEKTTQYITVSGRNGTKIPYRFQVSSSASPDLVFSNIETTAEISVQKASVVTATVGEVVPGKTYTLSIDGESFSTTAEEVSTKATILTALAANVGDTINASVSNDMLTLSSMDKADTFAFDSNLTLGTVSTPVAFEANDYGAIDPAIGTLTNIVSAIDGVSSVRNDVAANVGRDNETDIALRQRWNASVYDRSMTMVESIRAGIFRDTTGVTACLVYENDKDVVDEDGRPPHSIEAVVAGGLAQDISTAILRYKAPGIDTFGTESAQVYDSQGIPHIMNFNRPESIKLWLRVKISENPEEGLPAAALHEIQAALAEKGAMQNIGEDVILQRYFATIFQATRGVGYISLVAATGDTPGEYSSENIIISPRQVAEFDISRIEVSKV